jgi:aldose 1-epimerase
LPVRIEPWGRRPTGETVHLATLRNTRGFEARVASHGATIVGLKAPDRDGRLDEVVLGFADFADYVSDAYLAAAPYFGATIGRYANRIGGGRFVLDGRTHDLARNEGANQLHGGPEGFSQALWALAPLPDENGVSLSLESPDGDQGFPGTLRVRIEMVVGDDNVLVLRYRAVTDRPTHLNLTSHPYFNLGGRGSTIRDHRLRAPADRFTPTNEAFIPTGEIAGVAGTLLDLRGGVLLGDVLDEPSLAASRGLNHNYILDEPGSLALAATLSHDETGRTMEVWTTQPGLQVYSAGFLADIRGSNGEIFGRDAGLCLETQGFPDAPNQPTFPSTRLDPDEIFVSETQFRFSTIRER